LADHRELERRGGVRLVRGQPAVHQQRLPGDGRRLGARQVAHGARHLLGGDEPAERHPAARWLPPIAADTMPNTTGPRIAPVLPTSA